MSLASFHTLRLEPTPELRDLVAKVQRFHHLQDMGMFGGKFGAAEANRRNAEIVCLRNQLGLNRRELTLLVNLHTTQTPDTTQRNQ